MNKAITEFTGEYSFLSNDEGGPILITQNGTWSAPTVAHAYEALKTKNPIERLRILTASTPEQARKISELFSFIRSDWNEVKEDFMRMLIRQKFLYIKGYKEKLLATGDLEIKDEKIGKILMEVREKIRNNEY